MKPSSLLHPKRINLKVLSNFQASYHNLRHKLKFHYLTTIIYIKLPNRQVTNSIKVPKISSIKLIHWFFETVHACKWLSWVIWYLILLILLILFVTCPYIIKQSVQYYFYWIDTKINTFISYIYQVNC